MYNNILKNNEDDAADSSSEEEISSENLGKTIYVQDCMVELAIEVDEKNYQPVYTMRAVPYVLKDQPFSDLDSNIHFIHTEDQDLYNFFKVNGSDNILELIKAFQNENLEIGNNLYCPTYYAVIHGTLADSMLPKYFQKFENAKIQIFLSYIDLLIRHEINLEPDHLEKQFLYQKQTYGLELFEVEKKEVIARLQHHPSNVRERDLKQLIKSHKSLEQKPSSTHYEYVHAFISWLSNDLNYFWPKSAQQNNLQAQVVPVNKNDLVQERVALIARLNEDRYASIATQKNDLKRLIQLRPYYEPNEIYYARLAQISSVSHKFWESIDKPECWQDPMIIQQARKLIIQNILVSEEILADMEAFIRQAGFEPTATRVAFLLTHQDFSFCRNFIYSGIIDFYAYYREKGWSKIIEGYFINDQPVWGYNPSNRVQTNQLFFTKGTQENELRKLYNTFIKYGFYQRYGKEQNGQNDFRACLNACDHRFVRWTPLDSKTQEQCPESWMQFFQRKINGNASPATQEEYTYSHPIYDTRPT